MWTLFVATLLATSASQAGESNGQPGATFESVAQPGAASEQPGDCACRSVPALTPVEIEVLAEVSSKTSKSGDMFPIRLASPIVVDGVEVIPAGAVGQGEVVHAKKSGGGGAGGELVLAARYLAVGGRRLLLRSMALVEIGKDQTVLAMAASQAIGPFAFAVTGRNTQVAPGTRATAKTAQPFELAAQ